jgi:tetratricopeptide (TPR) repeat protein
MWLCLAMILGPLALLIAWTFYQHKRSKANEYDQTGPFILKMAASGLMIVLIIGCLSMGPLGLVLVIAPAFMLGLLWVGPLMDLVGGKAIDSIMGGGEELEPKPLYSVAEAKWRSGKPKLAIELIDEELEKFPGNFEGQMLKATIQMESLQDFSTAEGTLLSIAAEEQHEPGQIARALNQLADWQKKKGQDEAMRLTLTGLRDRFPGSGIELASAQRLARLDFSVDSTDRRDASELVSECLKQLEKHPLDNQTREQLARIYFNRYGKPDLAWEELNKLFENPFQQPRDLARWLNLMADWHLEKNNPEGARQCLQQVIARFADLPFAEEAQARLTRMQDVV